MVSLMIIVSEVSSFVGYPVSKHDKYKIKNSSLILFSDFPFSPIIGLEKLSFNIVNSELKT